MCSFANKTEFVLRLKVKLTLEKVVKQFIEIAGVFSDNKRITMMIKLGVFSDAALKTRMLMT